MLFAIMLAVLGIGACFYGFTGIQASKTIMEAIYYQFYIVSGAVLLGCGSICYLLDKIIEIIKAQNKE